MSAHDTPCLLAHCRSLQWDLALPLSVECDGHLPHAHCTPGCAASTHSVPLRMTHSFAVASQRLLSFTQLKSVVDVQLVLR